MTAHESSVTTWLNQLQASDPEAARKLWERYFRDLLRLAHRRLQGARRGAADEEDVVLDAFDSFIRAVQARRFPQLHDRHNLWVLLLQLTARRADELRRHERAQKRGGSRQLESVSALERVASPEPTPEFAAVMAEEYESLLDLLDDDELQRIAVWRMEGYTNAEIAARIGRVESTVERRLRLIRRMWEKELGENRR
jgi:RNA polymerase sigma factor (sigma-70 family)